MKKQTNDQTKVKNQFMGINGESLTGAHEATILLKPSSTKSNTIQVQNIGKDPPGRWRSPGVACCLDPDNRPDIIKNNKTLFNIDFQIFKQIQIPNFFNN